MSELGCRLWFSWNSFYGVLASLISHSGNDSDSGIGIVHHWSPQHVMTNLSLVLTLKLLCNSIALHQTFGLGPTNKMKQNKEKYEEKTQLYPFKICVFLAFFSFFFKHYSIYNSPKTVFPRWKYTNSPVNIVQHLSTLSSMTYSTIRCMIEIKLFSGAEQGVLSSVLLAFFKFPRILQLIQDFREFLDFQNFQKFSKSLQI